MRKILIGIGIVMALSASSQEVQVMSFPELQKKILSADNGVTIFNFWATWCAPCLRELPHFEAYSENKDVKIYLVSLDFFEDLDKVKKLVKEKGLKSDVIYLNEKDYNSYMDKLSKEWTGAIPATLFVDKWGKTKFHEKELSKEDLQRIINGYLN